jgi:prophage endopeptidase
VRYWVALAAAAGFGAAWYVQGLRWAEDVQSRDLAAANAISVNVAAVAAKMESDRAESEKIRAAYLDYRKGAELEISDLERRVSAGPERLYLKANCPAVPASGADAGRAGSGTAELDATATGLYFALERGLAEQYGLLQLCRSELKKRSAP